MSVINVKELPVVERLPGWRGRFFHSAHMTFAHYDFDEGARIHEHHHVRRKSITCWKARWRSPSPGEHMLLSLGSRPLFRLTHRTPSSL